MIDSLWYAKAWYRWLLAPLTVLFWLLSKLRRIAFQLGIKSSEHPGVPVIVVGNLTVGGNGKTPLVIHLVEKLKTAGFNPGVLSRGYGGSIKHHPCLVESYHSAEQVGDEPCLMFQRLACPVVIDPKRSRGARLLVDTGVDVIVCDDGLQHYALKRDIEIVVVDGERRFGNRQLLPMGPLREGLWRLNSVDFVVTNGTSQNDEVAMLLSPGNWVNLVDKEREFEMATDTTAIAGIGNPQRFFKTLQHIGIGEFEQRAYPDHYQYTAADIPHNQVLMTEKDAVKCRPFAHDNCWYLPVSAEIDEVFSSTIIKQLRQLNGN